MAIYQSYAQIWINHMSNFQMDGFAMCLSSSFSKKRILDNDVRASSLFKRGSQELLQGSGEIK